jgi:regulator of CtrA degradation
MDYIAKGDGLFERVQKFDRLERGLVEEGEADTAKQGDIADQLARLKAAFGELKR